MFLILAICWLEALWVYLLVLISEDTWKQVTDLFHPNNEGMINVDIIFVTLRVGIHTVTPTYITYITTWLFKSCFGHEHVSDEMYMVANWKIAHTSSSPQWNRRINYIYCCPQLTVTSYQQWIDKLEQHDNSTSYWETGKPAAYFPRLVHISQKSQTQAVGHNFQKVYQVP